MGLLSKSKNHRLWLWCSCCASSLVAAFWLYQMFKLPMFRWEIIWLPMGSLSGAGLCLYVDHLLHELSKKVRKLRADRVTYLVYIFMCRARSYSPELGFPANHNEHTPYLAFGGGNTVFAELQQIKTELEAELSSPSDDSSGELSDANKEGTSWKRKRKTKKTIVLFMEKMIRKVMEKQEMMHKELMETLERREKERIMREEASKQQEIERAKRDEELRSQERARSLALISFIENLLGLEIPIPESMVPASPSSMDKSEEGGQLQDLGSSKRWPKSEIQALINVRSGLEEKFVKGPKNSVWEEVAVTLCNMGYKRTAKKCEEKWENINKYYRRTTESGNKRPQNSKACPCFHELELLYKSGFIASPNQSNSNEKLAIEYSSPFSQ